MRRSRVFAPVVQTVRMRLPDPFETFLARPPAQLRVAVVGASNDPRKFGSIILRAVQGRGSVVVPVTPSSSSVDGVDAVARLADAADSVDFASFVVPPARALKALASLPERLRLPVWFQPGSYDDDVLAWCKSRAFPLLVGPCILVEFDARRSA